MSHLLTEVLAQAANGSPATVALSAESVTVLLFASEFLGVRNNWLDRALDPLDEVTDTDWDAIEKLVGNAYEEIMRPIVGTVWPVMTTTIPVNMLLCDGSTHQRVDYPGLYAVIDATFILNADQFKVPDLLGRVPIGAGQGFGLPNYAMGAKAGEHQHNLTIQEMPAHDHNVNDPGHQHAPLSPLTSFVGARPSGTLATNNGTNVGAATQTAVANTNISLGLRGDGLAHNNMQPYLALRWAVVAY